MRSFAALRTTWSQFINVHAALGNVLSFLTQRLLQIIPTLILVSMLIFGLQQLLPGDPALIMAGEERDPAVLEEIRQQYRLNEPIPIQYFYWIKGVLSGNLGESMRLKARSPRWSPRSCRSPCSLPPWRSWWRWASAFRPASSRR